MSIIKRCQFNNVARLRGGGGVGGGGGGSTWVSMRGLVALHCGNWRRVRGEIGCCEDEPRISNT